MDKSIYKKMGNMEQAAFVRPVTYMDGRARGLEALQFYNGVPDFTVLKSRCMDIGDMRYKGVNIAFLAKTGLLNAQPSILDCALDEQAGLMGGFMFTCGLSNAGAICEEGGVKYPFHGQIRATPAAGCRFGINDNGDSLLLWAEGEMREAVLQGRNLRLLRRIETHSLESGFSIRDEIVNEGYCDEPLLLIYHVNFGWPLLDEGVCVVIPTNLPREERMGAPKDICDELVLTHDAIQNEDGNVICSVINEKLRIGASLMYNKGDLPVLGEWRSEAAGDYVVGFEPGLCGVEGRAELLRRNRARILKAGESIHTWLDFRFLTL